MLDFPKHFTARIRKFEKECAGFAQNNIRTNDIVFLGDSLIEGLKCKSNWINRGICSDHLRYPDYNVFQRLESNRLHPDPSAIVTLIGINDLCDEPNAVEVHLNSYRFLLNNLKELYPKARLVVTSLLPVCKPDLNTQIKEFNKGLAMIAESRNAVYLDLHRHLYDFKTQKPKHYFFKNDGVHLNLIGYMAMSAFFGKNFERLSISNYCRHFDEHRKVTSCET